MLVPWVAVGRRWPEQCLTLKNEGGFHFKHRPAISLHLPQCTFVCTFVSEMRKHRSLITQGQLCDTLEALSAWIQCGHYIYRDAKLESHSLPVTSGFLIKNAKAAKGKAS